jgi:hypothetical protein
VEEKTMNFVLRFTIALVGVLCAMPLSAIAQGGSGFEPIDRWVRLAGAQVRGEPDIFVVQKGTIRTRRLIASGAIAFL